MARRRTERQQRAGRAVFALRWGRFNYDQTPESDREWLRVNCDNLVSSVVSGPCTQGLVVSTICNEAREPVLIQFLSLQLQAPVLIRDKVVFGSVWDTIDQICRNYSDVQWWVSTRRLTIDAVPPPVPEFYQIAGRLMCEMRGKNPANSRVSQTQYLEVTDRLERFTLREFLPKQSRQKLALWNQKSQTDPIRSFSQAIKAKKPAWLRRETLRVLYRAEEKFKKSRTLSMGPFVV
jgi:hypothetical protein